MKELIMLAMSVMLAKATEEGVPPGTTQPLQSLPKER
jgi:hypothetical protein